MDKITVKEFLSDLGIDTQEELNVEEHHMYTINSLESNVVIIKNRKD